MAHYSESSGWCPTCNEQRLVRRKSISGPVHAIHITLAILTAGIWLLVYGINAAARKDEWRCSVCGSKVKAGALPPQYQATGLPIIPVEQRPPHLR
jgi:hypothetical protein